MGTQVTPRPEKTMNIGQLKDGGKLECDVSSLVDTRLLIQANYGGGKSWLLRLIDETNQRLFVGRRRPARLLVSDTSLGETVAKMKAWGDTDNLFYDGATGRYISLSAGEGCISVFEETNPRNYREFHTIATPLGSRTSLFVPASRTLYVALLHRESQKAAILIFAAMPKL
jgi:hypothetical protein